MARKKSHRNQTSPRPARQAKRKVSLEDLLSEIRMDPENLNPRMALAEFYLRSGAGERVAEAFSGAVAPGGFADVKEESRYYRLRGFGHAYRNELVEAEDAAIRALRVDPESLDALFVLAFVHLSLKEYDHAANAAERFVNVFRFVQRSKVTVHQFAGSQEHLSQVHNFQGSAAMEQRNFEAAISFFEQAIKADPANHLPYLNLVRVYRLQNRQDDAREVIERGLKTCSQVHELRLMADSLLARGTVSACMIVKNEEELLPGCLDSIRSWVDEIILVDTGSTDRTVEIAESYGARVFQQPWEGDFSLHRNHSIAQATCDWVFVIDADERLAEEDLPELRRYLNASESQVLSVNVFNVGRTQGEQVTFLPSVRFFRRELGLRYEGIVHNQLRIDKATPVQRTGVTIRHLGYNLEPEKLRAKAARTIELLDRQLAQNPKDAFALFNYAQVLLGLGVDAHSDNARKIKDAAGRAVRLTRPNVQRERHIHLMALYQSALVRFLLSQYEGAAKYAHEALKHKPDYLDPILLLGHVGLRRGDLAQAEQYYRQYLKVQESFDESAQTDDIIVVHPRSAHHAWYGLALVAEARRDWVGAGEWYERVMSVAPDHAEVSARLGYLRLRLGHLDEAEELFSRQLQVQPDSHLGAVGKAVVLYERGRTLEAEDLVKAGMESCPADAPEILLHASALEQIDRKAEALWFVEKACTGVSIAPERIRTIAEIFFRLGRYEQAAEYYARLVDEGLHDGELLNDLGGCCYKTGDFVQAEEWYRLASEQVPSPAISWRNLGLTQVRLNKAKEALASLERYLQQAPEQMEIVHLVGDLYARLGQDGRAIPFYEKCLQANRSDRLAMFSLSECYLRLGHRDSALLGYRRVLDLDRDFEPAQRRLSELNEVVRV